MEFLFNKKLAAYSFGGLLICFLAIMGFVYSQLKDLDNIKAMVVEKIEELTGSKVSIGVAELKYEKGVSVRLRNVSIGSASRASQQVLIKSAWCVVRLWPLLNRKIEIKKLILKGASIQLVRDKQGRFNYGNSSRWSTEIVESRLFELLGASFVHRLSLSDSEIRFLDYYGIPGPDPLSFSVKGINLDVDKRFFKNIFSFNLNGEIPNAHQPTVFQLSGSFDNIREGKGGRQNPIQGVVRLNQLHLEKFWPYLKNVLPDIFQDSWISLESDFSGNLRGNLNSEGRLKYSTIAVERKSVLRRPDSLKSGALDYSFALDKDSIKVQGFKLLSGPLNFSATGNLTRFKSQDPRISFAIQTGEFGIKKTRQYLPLMFFPETLHEELHRRFDNGIIEIKALQFDGSLAQLQKLNSKENKNLFTAEVAFKQVDWRSPLPPLKKVAGSLKYKNGDGFFTIVSAKFKELSVANLKGTVHSMMNNPIADFSFENKLELKKLNHALKKVIKGESYENILDDYKDISGKGLLKVKLQGPLEELEKTSITSVLSMKGVSFYDSSMKSRVKNFNGEIYFTHLPREKQKELKSQTPLVAVKNLSGEFGKSKFYNMQGEILRQGEAITQRMNAVYHFNAAEIPKIVADIDFSGPLFNLFEKADFEEGDIEVHYKSLMDFKKPKEKKDWGKIEINNLSLRHPSGFQPLLKLVGEISWGDGAINLNKITGWYGSSPIRVDGKLTPRSKSLVGFDINADLNDWTRASFKDIPHLQNLDFMGLISAEVNLSGDRHSLRFKKKLDLTKSSYKFNDDIYKKENIRNEIDIEGTFSKNEGIVVDQLKFVIDDNGMTGKARIKSFVDPEYSIRINAAGLRTVAMASMLDVLQNNKAGKVDFNISGRGNLNRLEDSLFKGSAILRDLIFKWKDRKNPLTLSADIKFSGNNFSIRSGQMKSGRSQLTYSGMGKIGEYPELILKLIGKTLAVDELISEKTDHDGDETNFKDILQKSRLLSNGKSKISVDLDQLDYKWLTLSDVSGRFSLKDQEITFDGLQVGFQNPIKLDGKLSVEDSEAIRFETQLQADNIKAKELLAMFGDHFKGGLTGKVKKLDLSFRGNGRNLSESIRTLNGKASVYLANGTIDKKKLKAGVFELFGLEVPGEDKSKIETDKGSSNYVVISGDFAHIGGIAETENFIYETDQRKSFIVGKFDLNHREMDTVVGVAPMPGLDKFLTQIPLVGKILTAGDEGSLIKTYHTVTGPFDDPEVTAVPLTSLGKKFMGLFQGILQTSEEILNLPSTVGAGKVAN